jgi:diguanylate cyclase (GGDEF)-like protein
MDNTARAPERAAQQTPSAEAPAGWGEVHKGLAAEHGLSLILVEGRTPPPLLDANNNSVCAAFMSSRKHAHLCQPDCGEAHSRAHEAGAKTHYRCHAGLHCFTMPVSLGDGKQAGKKLAVIGGRCFISVADYRALVERVHSGDLTELLAFDPFRNVHFASRQDLEEMAAHVAESANSFAASPRTKGEAARDEAKAATNGARDDAKAATNGARHSAENGHGSIEGEKSAASRVKGKASKAEGRAAEPGEKANGVEEKANGAAEETRAATEESAPRAASEGEAERARGAGALQTRGGRAPVQGEGASAQSGGAAAQSLTIPGGGSLEEACRKAARTLVEEYGVASVALLLRDDESFYTVSATGTFEKKPPRVALKPKEIKLLLAATHEDSIAVPAAGRASSKHEEAVELFPLTVGEEIKGALLVGDRDLGDERRAALASFCRDISMPLELLRLREELERRVRAAMHLRAFTEVVNSARPEDAYAAILRHLAELLRSERGSLLLFDEGAGELSVKAAVGPRADEAREMRVRLGEGVAGSVMSEGRPAVVRDVSSVQGLRPAPAERSYKTKSFISYPLVIGGRKVGVLNVTDKAGGGDYDEVDLGLLELIAPQMALALDRVEWHRKATQFQLLSITDPLTGLVNRRYLEERLSEELERSKRHRFQMSFMMVDIDDFKAYNDTHGHQAGDLALEMTAQCLKTALRSADVAARYGGEEFSILLPQTGPSEARIIAERIRRRIERTQFPHGKAQPTGAVTVSVGISSFGPELDTPAEIIYAADRALYLAKSRGKNCVEVLGPKAAKGEGEES